MLQINADAYRVADACHVADACRSAVAAPVAGLAVRSAVPTAAVFAALAVCVSLCGCAAKIQPATPAQVNLPDGSKGYALHCSGHAGDDEACTELATRTCGGLYSIVDPKQPGPSVAVTGGDRTVLIKCLPP